MHSFIHPLGQAVSPVWESKTDWDIFKHLAKATSEMAKRHFSGPQKDIVMTPLSHDTADEITQPTIKDWFKGECEPVPGKSMPKFSVITRDFTQLYEKYITLGEGIREKGLGAHGNHYFCKEEYDEMCT